MAYAWKCLGRASEHAWLATPSDPESQHPTNIQHPPLPFQHSKTVLCRTLNWRRIDVPAVDSTRLCRPSHLITKYSTASSTVCTATNHHPPFLQSFTTPFHHPPPQGFPSVPEAPPKPPKRQMIDTPALAHMRAHAVRAPPIRIAPRAAEFFSDVATASPRSGRCVCLRDSWCGTRGGRYCSTASWWWPGR